MSSSSTTSALRRFEACSRPDGTGWDIFVIWEHSLRERVTGTEFPTKEGADRWISSQSRIWLEEQRARLDKRTNDGSV